MSNIYDDGMDPKVAKTGVLVEVRVPDQQDTHWARVEVRLDDGYCELRFWRWGNHRSQSGGYRLTNHTDKARWDAMNEVWEWLREWELVELKPIGPEDSEYFATAKLLGE